ncbi:MAG: TatD family hydrolase [Geobacteraceae bacterium]|nr:TatD family hydrolase [Geobacteraceae bacterium]
MYVDTHCHLDHPSLATRLDDVLASARAVGVERFIVPGVSPEKWEGIARLAAGTPGVFAAFGLHPMLAARYDEPLLEALAEYAAKAVAIGEIGLDYALAGVSRKEQATAFRGQLRLAVRMGLPVIIHCRQAFDDLIHILREERVREVGGVMHAYSGSYEMACLFGKEGVLISFSGSVTYSNAVKTPRVASRIPLEQLLLETDSPDMAPEPYRGKINEPAFLLETARAVARIREIGIDEVAQKTTANAERLFRI